MIAEKELGFDVEADKGFYKSREDLKTALGGKLNFYRLFVARALHLCRYGGSHGFIVPMALMGDAQAMPLRKHLVREYQLVVIEAFPQKDDPRNRVFEDAKLSTCVYVLRKTEPTRPFTLRVHPGRTILNASPQVALTADDLALLDPENLPIPGNPGTDARHVTLAVSLTRRCGGHQFGEVAASQQGEVNLTGHSDVLSPSPIGPEVLRGAHIDRYEFHQRPSQGSPQYLDVKKFLKGKDRESRAFDHVERRIGYQRGAAIDNWRRIIACVIESDSFCSDTVNYIVRPKLDFFFTLGLLNSSLFEWRFRLTSTNNHVNAYEVDALPLRLITIGTKKRLGEKQLTQAKDAYERASRTGDPKRLLRIVDECLSSSTGNHERTDVVHDLTGHLAHDLTGLVRRKQAEAGGFMRWLEGYLGLGIPELKNVTMIREYYRAEGGWDGFMSALEPNSAAIKRSKGVDLAQRGPREVIRREYETSTKRLRPILRGIDFAGRLIDEIVYRLYGLTDGEIAIVEGRG